MKKKQVTGDKGDNGNADDRAFERFWRNPGKVETVNTVGIKVYRCDSIVLNLRPRSEITFLSLESNYYKDEIKGKKILEMFSLGAIFILRKAGCFEFLNFA